jgi:hypothetical protein
MTISLSGFYLMAININEILSFYEGAYFFFRPPPPAILNWRFLLLSAFRLSKITTQTTSAFIFVHPYTGLNTVQKRGLGINGFNFELGNKVVSMNISIQ